MKVLILNPNLIGVGTYRRSFYFGREIARGGHEVTLVTVSKSSHTKAIEYYKREWLEFSQTQPNESGWMRIIEAPNMGYKLLPGWGSGPIDLFTRIKEIFTKKYDVVYGFEYQPNVAWPIYLSKPLINFRFISDWCDWHAGSSNQFRGIKLAQRIDGYFEENIRYWADKISVTSKILQDRAHNLGISPDKVALIPEGTPTEYLCPRPKIESRKAVGLPLDVPIFGAVRNGDMHREVKIFKRILQAVPNAIFLMIGRPSTSALSLAKELGIDKQIQNTGWVSDANYPVYLSAVDICFCPLEDNLNDAARWPAKILDFLTMGCATVTNGVGEVERLFRSRDVGLIVNQNDDDFADEMVSLFFDQERLDWYRHNARQVMVEEWDYKLRGEKIRALLDG